MIVSASYKTDIPAFYGEWFRNRFQAGYCMAVNPVSKKPFRVDLSRRAVDGFVFWTKNCHPFLSNLKEVADSGAPFVVQYTINGYPRIVEHSVVDCSRSINDVRLISSEYGTRVVVWRYDPVLFTDRTGFDFHVENFANLASQLEGATDEVVISFAQIYRKTRRNLDAAASRLGFSWSDPSDTLKRDLTAELGSISHQHGMRLAVCSQRAYAVCGAEEARCIDIARLTSVGGRPIRAPQRGNRPECGCFLSRDIGEYDTCPHGCEYCYAVNNRSLALHRYQNHDPDSPFLFSSEVSFEVEGWQDPKDGQKSLF